MPESLSPKRIPQHAEVTSALNKIMTDLNGVVDYINSLDRMAAIQPIKASVVEVEHKKQLQSTKANPEIIASVKAARVAIGIANKPLPLGLLYQEVRAHGFQITTNDPKGTYGARLRDHAKRVGLVFLKHFGWWLAERPYGPADYTPGTSTKRRFRVGQGVKKRLFP